jgi:hypothetical protein
VFGSRIISTCGIVMCGTCGIVTMDHSDRHTTSPSCYPPTNPNRMAAGGCGCRHHGGRPWLPPSRKTHRRTEAGLNPRPCRIRVPRSPSQLSAYPSDNQNHSGRRACSHSHRRGNRPALTCLRSQVRPATPTPSPLSGPWATTTYESSLSPSQRELRHAPPRRPGPVPVTLGVPSSMRIK